MKIFHKTLGNIEECELCAKQVYFADSWSPDDLLSCSECDTEVTGRSHKPSLPIIEGMEHLVRIEIKGRVISEFTTTEAELQAMLHSMTHVEFIQEN